MTADIALTKQAAARRLISSAVAIAVADGDPLAIHLIAASALKILRDLLKKRGPNYLDIGLIQGLYDVALRRSRGEASPFPIDPYTEGIVEALSTAITNGHITSLSEIKVNGSSNEYQFFRYINDPYNFLKHADSDPLGHLNEADFRPTETILHCVAAYAMLFPNETLDSHVADFAMENIDQLKAHKSHLQDIPL